MPQQIIADHTALFGKRGNERIPQEPVQTEAVDQNQLLTAADIVYECGRGDAYCRSTMSFLISPMALAGLRCFGHVLVQFMMVWQRNRRNGSSR